MIVKAVEVGVEDEEAAVPTVEREGTSNKLIFSLMPRERTTS